MQDGNNTDIQLPYPALTALSLLEEASYEAWCVGGFVRDALLGKASEDIDIATNAPWEAVKSRFEKAGYHVFETGTKHGTVTALVDGEPLEITTYRADGDYLDYRHPSSVSFVDSIEEDLARRDFTINALAFHPKRGILDPFGGLDDLNSETIRAVGVPSKRFQEDALRILRGVRFHSQLGFDLDEETQQAMFESRHLLEHIATERIAKEFELFLLGEHVHHAMMGCIDILGVCMPELLPMRNFDQKTKYHCYDVLEHTAFVVQNTPPKPLVRWSAMFHDIGKPASFTVDELGVGHFYGHPMISVDIARDVLKRLKISNALTQDILLLVKVHDDVVEPTVKSVKRMIRKLDGKIDLFYALCDLKRGDTLSQADPYTERAHDIDVLIDIADEIVANEEAFSLKKLELDGSDIISLGISPGPRIGEILEKTLDAVIEEEIPNNHAQLLSYAERLIRHSKNEK